MNEITYNLIISFGLGLGIGFFIGFLFGYLVKATERW